MSKNHSYTITTENNKSEKEAINFLLESDSKFLLPDNIGRKKILEFLGIEKKFIRAFDLVIVQGHKSLDEIIYLKNSQDIVLVELKTTKKNLPLLPKGFFFGATENEFELANKLGDNYKFCFVSLHEKSKNYVLLNLNELNKIIRNKRIQFQINL